MSLSKIDDGAVLEEKSTQEDIFTSIDKFQDIIFNAGAGAGKTFALIESLKYIIATHGKKLANHNQKIMCITYTNVAKDEIQERLGNSDLAQISTIHENLWKLIMGHQEQLVAIHIDKLNFELIRLKNDLEKNQDESISKTFKVYRELTAPLKQSFTTYIMSNKDLYYSNYNKKAGPFKAALNDVSQQYPNSLKNTGNFKKIVNTIFKIDNYEQCLIKIKDKEDGYTSIKYDYKYNSDILHKMLISHDSLLEYSLKMIQRYNLLKRIVIDSLPYIMIDEYQDTSENVVTLMNLLSVYSKKIKSNLFIGYFGDVVQNIYQDGVGHRINNIHPNLHQINKKFNRRSYSEVVKVINKIRADEITQESIYSDSSGGSVQFYSGQGEERLPLINKFIEKCKYDWNSNFNNKLHCLVLTNKLVAELSGFPDIYRCFSNTSFYKRFYDKLNGELLSNETSKLGDVPNIIYKILRLKTLLDDSNTSLNNIIGGDTYSNLSFTELKNLVFQLKCFTGKTLNELIKLIFTEYNKPDKSTFFKSLICELVPLEIDTYDLLTSYFTEKLFYEQDDEAERDKGLLDDLLNIDIHQYELWFQFIENTQNTDVIYHTYHGTKGLEFENVVIIMENDFGTRNRNMFSSFFKSTINRGCITDSSELSKFINTRNLLYVSCSRAIKNLKILYLDDISTFENGINSIFENTKPFRVN